RLFNSINPDEVEPGGDFKSNINPDSLEILGGSFIENSLANAKPGITYQFERQGYFCVDPSPADNGKLVFNRTIALRDSWAKLDKSKQG
ncbi:MAG: glutamine--tRNA ligase, partial [Anaerolineales bacterium]|nr:glutamine--tRNA ligase [Anaerolineales bacterium]